MPIKAKTVPIYKAIFDFLHAANDMSFTSVIILSDGSDDCTSKNAFCIQLPNELRAKNNTIPFVYLNKYFKIEKQAVIS